MTFPFPKPLTTSKPCTRESHKWDQSMTTSFTPSSSSTPSTTTLSLYNPTSWDWLTTSASPLKSSFAASYKKTSSSVDVQSRICFLPPPPLSLLRDCEEATRSSIFPILYLYHYYYLAQPILNSASLYVSPTYLCELVTMFGESPCLEQYIVFNSHLRYYPS